ncbi:uncharacterized protein [Drosophila pseudoobscura]|uniref:Protein yellow n=1 Tax=Drosophila pseudoobscura pseudoobscura TaxID=46245 RepID=A0A6I8VKH5_DROPS|nr:uncharacterized protein LOC26531960 [Drosophila pseudoobscura]
MLAFDFKLVAIPLLQLLFLLLPTLFLVSSATAREVYMYVDMSGKPWEFEFKGFYDNTLRRRVTQVVYNGLWTDPMVRGRDPDSADPAACPSPWNPLIALAVAAPAASFVLV